MVFIIIVTSAVYVVQVRENESINKSVDALYFTIATLTTTGFGEIILVNTTGRLLAVIIIIVGAALFIRLVQTVFRPSKVRHECRDCGVTRHEQDAVHCQPCGRQLHIKTEGVAG